jgi:hypothetical protein
LIFIISRGGASPTLTLIPRRKNEDLISVEREDKMHILEKLNFQPENKVGHKK